MPRYIRPGAPGATIFFTVALAARGSDLLVREVGRLRQAVRQTRLEQPFRIDAWVVPPDHLHCIWKLPPSDCDYPTRWKTIKAHFTRSVGLTGRRSPSKAAKGETGIWQRRYWDHHIRNGSDYRNHVRYCWGNPVKHGLVDRPVDWPFSSLHRDIQAGRADPCFVDASAPGTFGEPVW